MDRLSLPSIITAEKGLTTLDKWAIMTPFNKFIRETEEAEIKAIVHAQRVRGAVSRIERKSPNGPLRARGTTKFV
jgi:hypothetical protein